MHFRQFHHRRYTSPTRANGVWSQSTEAQLAASCNCRYGVFIDNAVQEDVTTVPGIGPANAALLEAAGVSTTHQLIGQFLVFRTAGMSVPVSPRHRCAQVECWTWITLLTWVLGSLLNGAPLNGPIPCLLVHTACRITWTSFGSGYSPSRLTLAAT